MLRPTRLTLVFAVLLLSACGDAGLNAQGLVSVTTPDSTVRRFEFPSQTRLDGTSPGRFTGSCILRRTRDAEGVEQWATIVELRSGGTAPGDDSPLGSVTLMQNTGSAPADGRVEIDLGGTVLTEVSGECNIDMPYALADGVVGLEGTCQVSSATSTATVEIALDLAGCDVEL